jgi:serine/threonine protein kinase
MAREKTTWLDCQVGDYLIEETLGEGPFSTVYRGRHLKTSKNCAFKAAKEEAEIDYDDIATGCFPTQAYATVLGGIHEFIPDTKLLLKLQFERLLSAKSAEIVAVRECVELPGLAYYSMEYLEGISLRQLIRQRQITLQELLSLSDILDTLSTGQLLDYHGDLKPENIMYTPRGPVLIDPGYFGFSQKEENSLQGCAVTTALYYPFLVPDDLFAFGLLMWECLLGCQPLNAGGSLNNRTPAQIGPKLSSVIANEEYVGKYYLSPILNLALPSSLHPEIEPPIEAFLLKALRLQHWQTGGLEWQPGFTNFAELSASLRALQAQSSSM